MVKVKVLLTAESDDKILEQLDSFCEIEKKGWKTEGIVLSEDELIESLRGKEIFITSYDKVTRRVIEKAGSLKLIMCTRSNPVNIDIEAAKEKGIIVANTPARNSDATAEFAVGMLLDIARNITFANRAIMDGSIIAEDKPEPKNDVTWGLVRGNRPYNMFQGVQIKNKKIGIVGFGSIGKRVAKILEGFGAYILVFDPFVSKTDIDSPAYRKVGFDELVSDADFISCHIKITPQTTNLFNKETFDKMKPSAYLINNSRGKVINEPDLIEALKNGIIAGAALDVFDNEPLYKGHPLLDPSINNLLLTPHISGASPDSIVNGTIMIVDEVIRYIKNETLLNSK